MLSFWFSLICGTSQRESFVSLTRGRSKPVNSRSPSCFYLMPRISHQDSSAKSFICEQRNLLPFLYKRQSRNCCIWQRLQCRNELLSVDLIVIDITASIICVYAFDNRVIGAVTFYATYCRDANAETFCHLHLRLVFQWTFCNSAFVTTARAMRVMMLRAQYLFVLRMCAHPLY